MRHMVNASRMHAYPHRHLLTRACVIGPEVMVVFWVRNASSLTSMAVAEAHAGDPPLHIRSWFARGVKGHSHGITCLACATHLPEDAPVPTDVTLGTVAKGKVGRVSQTPISEHPHLISPSCTTHYVLSGVGAEAARARRGRRVIWEVNTGKCRAWSDAARYAGLASEYVLIASRCCFLLPWALARLARLVRRKPPMQQKHATERRSLLRSLRRQGTLSYSPVIVTTCGSATSVGTR